MSLASMAQRAHPRPCGEHVTAVPLHGLNQGSSPPVRGALHEAVRAFGVGGLIPARAGSTYPDGTSYPYS